MFFKKLIWDPDGAPAVAAARAWFRRHADRGDLRCGHVPGGEEACAHLFWSPPPPPARTPPTPPPPPPPSETAETVHLSEPPTPAPRPAAGLLSFSFLLQGKITNIDIKVDHEMLASMDARCQEHCENVERDSDVSKLLSIHINIQAGCTCYKHGREEGGGD